MKVLYGLWDDERPRAGLATAARRAAGVGDEFVVGVVGNDGDPPEELIAYARATLSDAGLAPAVRTLSGDPAGRLVAVAEREGFDRIVLGGGGRSPLGKVAVDPTVQAVLLSSPVSVTVIRQP